jgi:hypothetical protein
MKYGNIKVGSKVVTLKDLQNGGSIIPKGSVGVVQQLYGGLHLYFEHRCEYCHFGDRVWISRVQPYQVELIEVGTG